MVFHELLDIHQRTCGHDRKEAVFVGPKLGKGVHDELSEGADSFESALAGGHSKETQLELPFRKLRQVHLGMQSKQTRAPCPALPCVAPETSSAAHGRHPDLTLGPYIIDVRLKELQPPTRTSL